MSPALLTQFPDLDERLATGGALAYTQSFLIAARQLQASGPFPAILSVKWDRL